MKKLLPILLFIAIFTKVNAQKDSLKRNDEIKTIFGNNQKTSHGFYIGFDMGATEIDNREAFMAGGRVGWILNHGFSFGFGGYGLTTNSVYNPSTDEFGKLDAGYGGIVMELTPASKWPVHLNFPILLGGGSSFYTSSSGTDWWDNSTLEETDLFWVVEPGANIECNITKFFRIGGGLKYRFTYGLTPDLYTPNNLDGLTGEIFFKLGKF